MASAIDTSLASNLYNTPTGWVPQPNVRGTIDIIWATLVIVFTSTWTVLHINLPRPKEGYFQILVRKARWAVFCVYAPEAVSLVAAVQRQSARRSRDEMRAAGLTTWTPTHGFFADMGGFIIRPPDTTPFPVNSRALYYLVKKKYIDPPIITKDDILDRGKADGFAKLAACFQGAWLIMQVIARPIQGLDISPLELVTTSLILCSAATYYFWVDKPLGVEFPTYIELRCPVEQIVAEGGEAAKEQWQDTPLDFVEQPGWKEWKRRAWMREFGGLKDRPIQRIPNDYVEGPKSLGLSVCLWLLTCAYASIHVAGWNFTFPTPAEVYVWRANSGLLLSVLFGWGFVEVLTVRPGLNFNFTILGIWRKKSTKNTVFRKSLLDVPGTISAMSYFVARTALVVQAFVTLRQMPSSVYVCVDWTRYLPHV